MSRAPVAARLRRIGATAALVAAGALLFGTWAAVTGRYGGPDEPAHVVRSYAVAHGRFVGQAVEGLPPGFRRADVPVGIGTGDPSCYRHDPARPAACAAATGPADDATVAVATSAGMHPPWYHAAVGVPVRLLHLSPVVGSFRTVAVVLVAGLVALAVWRAARHGRAWWLLVASTPAAWFLGGVVNPNSVEVASALVGWVGVAVWSRDRPGVRRALWVGLPFALATAMRPTALVAGAAAWAVVELVHRPSARERTAIVASLAAGAGALLAWGVAAGVVVDDDRTAVDEPWWRDAGTALTGVPATVREAVGSLGWSEYSAPAVALGAWVFAVAVLVVRSRRPAGVPGGSARRATALAAGAIAAAVLVVPVVLEAGAAGAVGHVWQGRYSLGAAIGAAALLGLARDAPPARWTATAVAAIVVAEVATFVAVLRRSTAGTSASWWPWELPSVTPWLTPAGWLAAHLVALVAFALAVRVVVATAVRSADRDDVAEHVDHHVGRAAVVVHVEPSAAAELEVGLVGHGDAGSGVDGRRLGPGHT